MALPADMQEQIAQQKHACGWFRGRNAAIGRRDASRSAGGPNTCMRRRRRSAGPTRSSSSWPAGRSRHRPSAFGVLALVRSVRVQAFDLMQRLNPDQAWFWTEEWQAGEREVDRNIAAGNLVHFASDEEFDAALTLGRPASGTPPTDAHLCVDGAFMREYRRLRRRRGGVPAGQDRFLAALKADRPFEAGLGIGEMTDHPGIFEFRFSASGRATFTMGRDAAARCPYRLAAHRRPRDLPGALEAPWCVRHPGVH